MEVIIQEMYKTLDTRSTPFHILQHLKYVNFKKAFLINLSCMIGVSFPGTLYRRMFRIPWTVHITNIEMLKRNEKSVKDHVHF